MVNKIDDSDKKVAFVESITNLLKEIIGKDKKGFLISQIYYLMVAKNK
jgi:phenylpyruvate tautomerase PptA (4-oxalocrotonate tautomerase family)